MADETGQVGCAAPRLLRLLALTTNCHLAQDILSTSPVSPLPYRYPCGGFLPFRSRLLFTAFSVVWLVGGNRLRGSPLAYSRGDPPLGYLLRIPLILRVRICRVSSS